MIKNILIKIFSQENRNNPQVSEVKKKLKWANGSFDQIQYQVLFIIKNFKSNYNSFKILYSQ